MIGEDRAGALMCLRIAVQIESLAGSDALVLESEAGRGDGWSCAAPSRKPPARIAHREALR